MEPYIVPHEEEIKDKQKITQYLNLILAEKKELEQRLHPGGTINASIHEPSGEEKRVEYSNIRQINERIRNLGKLEMILRFAKNPKIYYSIKAVLSTDKQEFDIDQFIYYCLEDWEGEDSFMTAFAEMLTGQWVYLPEFIASFGDEIDTSSDEMKGTGQMYRY